MMYVCMYVCMNVCIVFRSEDNFWESALSNCVGPQDQSQVVMLGSKLFYLLNRLSKRKLLIKKQSMGQEDTG